MKLRIFAVLLAFMLLTGCTGGTLDNMGQSSAGGSLNSSCEHQDKNDDGVCDGCKDSVLVSVDFYCINDLHGKFSDGDNHPGVDELTTYLKNARQTDENVILLAAGDIWQGSSESNLTHGSIMTDWMNDLDFTAMTLGNHEFDWGEGCIEDNAEIAEFPFLAINIYDRTTNTLVDYCQESLLVDLGEIQIGIIGAIGDCYSSISSDKSKDIYFKTGSELTALVKAESAELKAEGADFIVYLIHDGYGSSTGTGSTSLSSSQMASYYDCELSNGYVDLVFEGHSHQQYLAEDPYQVPHLQNRGDNRGGISHVEIACNPVTGTTHITQAELVLASAYESLKDDDIVQDLLVKYADQISPANRVLGTNAYHRRSDYLRQVVADLYYDLGEKTWGDKYDIVLGGGFISVRSPYELPAGEVKYSQLQSVFPFDNDIVLCSVKGSDLLSKFINTTNKNYYICCSEDLAVLDVEPNGTYYIVVDTYTASYAPNRLTVVEEYEKGVYARDLLAQFIAAGGME